MTEETPGRPSWKRITTIAMWLCLLPPVGLWMLWRERTFSTTVKWRVLIYLCLMPVLAYLALSLWSVNHALQRLAP